MIKCDRSNTTAGANSGICRTCCCNQCVVSSALAGPNKTLTETRPRTGRADSAALSSIVPGLFDGAAPSDRVKVSDSVCDEVSSTVRRKRLIGIHILRNGTYKFAVSLSEASEVSVCQSATVGMFGLRQMPAPTIQQQLCAKMHGQLHTASNRAVRIDRDLCIWLHIARHHARHGCISCLPRRVAGMTGTKHKELQVPCCPATCRSRHHIL